MIAQIGHVRQTSANWRESIARYVQQHNRVIVPLASSVGATCRQQAFALDGLLNQPGWNKAEQATLREMICASATLLLNASDSDDPELKALFNRNSDSDFDARGRYRAWRKRR